MLTGNSEVGEEHEEPFARDAEVSAKKIFSTSEIRNLTREAIRGFGERDVPRSSEEWKGHGGGARGVGASGRAARGDPAQGHGERRERQEQRGAATGEVPTL